MKHKGRLFIIFGAAFIVMAVGLSLLWLWQIRSQTNRQVKAAMSYQVETVQAYLAQSQKETVALLAAKHGIYETQLERLLDEYLLKHDVGYKLRKDLYSEKAEGTAERTEIKVNANFRETLDDLAERYQIPKDKIAAIIVDYKTMNALDRGNLIENLITGGPKDSILKFSLKEIFSKLKGK